MQYDYLTEEEIKKIEKAIKRRRRRSFQYIEWKILGYVVAVVLLFSISYNYKYELERFLNPIYYTGAEQNQIIALNESEEPLMKVHYIDVGCADATFVELPNNKTMLIDCAGDLLETNNSVNALLQYLDVEIYSHRANKVIDYLVITHPDRDHYAGAKSVLRVYDVVNIIRPTVLTKNEYDFYFNNGTDEIEDLFPVKVDSEYEEFIYYLQNELKSNLNSNMIFGRSGLDFSDDNFKLEFIAPNRFDYGEEWNDFSSCIRLEYSNRVFIFTGDASRQIEQEIIENYAYDIDYLKADVLKIGHHGSETSCSNNFLYAVSADYYVVSTRNGVYSSVPSDSVLTNIEAVFPDSTTFRTDKNGNIVFSVSNDGNMGVYTTRGSFDFVSSFVYIKLYYVLIAISIMLFIFVFLFRAAVRDDILEMRRKKYEKQKKKELKLIKKRSKGK